MLQIGNQLIIINPYADQITRDLEQHIRWRSFCRKRSDGVIVRLVASVLQSCIQLGFTVLGERILLVSHMMNDVTIRIQNLNPTPAVLETLNLCILPSRHRTSTGVKLVFQLCHIHVGFNIQLWINDLIRNAEIHDIQ